MEQSIQRSFRKRYPMLAQATGKFEVLEHQTSRKSREGGTQVHKQKIVRMEHDNSEKTIWERLQELKKECIEEKQLAIHHLEDWPEQNLKKIVQAVFNDTTCKVTIFTTNKKKNIDQNASRKNNVPKEQRTYALVVEREGRDYREVLKDVRAAVSDGVVKDHIHTIRSTKEERLLIVLDKNQEASDKVKRLIESRSLKVKQTGPKFRTETIHLRGLDALATKEEVEEALIKEIGQDKVAKVGQMRPGQQNTQAVTAVIEATAAEHLLQKQVLRIGPAKCVAERRVRVQHCARCWSYGHETNNCKGPDRSKLCRICGDIGHIAKECKGNSRCVLCENVEHVLGSGKCKAFRQALSKARQKESNRLREKTTNQGQAEEHKAEEQALAGDSNAQTAEDNAMDIQDKEPVNRCLFNASTG